MEPTKTCLPLVIFLSRKMKNAISCFEKKIVPSNISAILKLWLQPLWQYSISKNTLQFITVANLQVCHSNGNRFMVWGHLNMRNSPSFPCHLFIKIDGKKHGFYHALLICWYVSGAFHWQSILPTDGPHPAMPANSRVGTWHIGGSWIMLLKRLFSFDYKEAQR